MFFCELWFQISYFCQEEDKPADSVKKENFRYQFLVQHTFTYGSDVPLISITGRFCNIP